MFYFTVFVVGMFSWSFVEYGMHNWNGHLCRGKTRFSRAHLRHHADPEYEQTTQEKILQTVPIGSLVVIISSLFIGWAGGFTYLGGMLLAYLLYSYSHWASHALPPKTAYGRWMRRHHFYHHFTNSKFNHGFTSPIWDMVFGTYRAPGVIRVPRKMAMVWLVDEETQEVHPEYAADYELIGRSRRIDHPESLAA